MVTRVPSPPPDPAPPRVIRWLPFALPLAFVTLAATSAAQKSPTYDETHYLGAGRRLLTAHRWDLPDSLLHPIFWTVWHDLPLLAASAPANVWGEPNGVLRGRKIMALRPDDLWLNVCRLSMLPFAVALGLVVFRWSRQLYGDAGGLVSSVLFCFCPNLLAHAPLVTPDVMLTCFAVLTDWRLWAVAKRPGALNTLYAGGALGFMLLSKHTALLLVPFFFIADFAYRAATGQFYWRSPRSLWRGLRHWPAVLGIGFLLVWAAYGFRVDSIALPGGARVVLPAGPYFDGALSQYLESRSPQSLFLMGTYSGSGWWYYYLVVCLIKVPAGVLLLLAGLIVARRKLGLAWRPDEWYLLVPFALVFLYVSFSNSLQNGFRYLLPVYPLLLVWLGNYGVAMRRGIKVRLGVTLLAAWTVVGTLLVWPDYVAYFNEFIGGSRNGYHWLTDSNVDWGQDLKELRRFMSGRGIERVGLSYFGTADPAHYGIEYDYLPSARSNLRRTPPRHTSEGQPRFVALSAYQYQAVDFPDKEAYRFFYRYVPNDVVGGSILVFDLQHLVPRTQAPLPLRIRQFAGTAAPDAPTDSCP
jgi:hypothetical protein